MLSPSQWAVSKQRFESLKTAVCLSIVMSPGSTCLPECNVSRSRRGATPQNKSIKTRRSYREEEKEMEFTLWTRDEKITRLHCHAGPDSSIIYGPYRNCAQNEELNIPPSHWRERIISHPQSFLCNKPVKHGGAIRLFFQPMTFVRSTGSVLLKALKNSTERWVDLM